MAKTIEYFESLEGSGRNPISLAKAWLRSELQTDYKRCRVANTHRERRSRPAADKREWLWRLYMHNGKNGRLGGRPNGVRGKRHGDATHPYGRWFTKRAPRWGFRAQGGQPPPPTHPKFTAKDNLPCVVVNWQKKQGGFGETQAYLAVRQGENSADSIGIRLLIIQLAGRSGSLDISVVEQYTITKKSWGYWPRGLFAHYSWIACATCWRRGRGWKYSIFISFIYILIVYTRIAFSLILLLLSCIVIF